MTYRTIIHPLTVMAILFACASAAEAFWFLPGFGNNSVQDARAQTFAANTNSIDLGAVTTGGTSGIPSTLDTDEASANLMIAVTDPAQGNWSSDSENGQGGPSIELNTEPFAVASLQNNNPIDLIQDEQETSPLDTSEGVIAISARDFDLALMGNRLSRPAPLDMAKSLSSQEMDRVLSSMVFDPRFDLMDGAAQSALRTFPINVLLEVEAGDTLSSLFQGVGISIVETQNAGRALGEVFNLGALRPGQVLELELDGAVEPFGPNRLQRLALSPTNLELIEVVQSNGSFESVVSNIELNRVLIHAAGSLATGSIYLDGDSMDIEGSMIANYVNALDAQVNFSRIQSVGDEIEMVYEAYFDDDGRLVDAGNVLYAAFRDSNGDDYEAFRFETEGKAAYFTRDARFTGQTNTLMRKPLGGGRLTSPFGMRTHPVSGDRRMHNGVDYGAACGTPIYAAGDGVISFAGWKGGYGRFIAIRHGSTFVTNYAHMRSFANGMRPGVRVRKGQLIGRVGTTGASTGCHLHYEVVRDGRRINPLSDHIPRGDDLTSAAKTRFSAFVSQMDVERDLGLTLPQAFTSARSRAY